MNDRTKIRTENLTREVEGNMLLDGVSVAVPTHRCTGIIGPSGAGKTTFLRLLNRLDEPTSGTVYLDETNYLTLDIRTLRQQIGLVPQNATMMERTVRENLTIGPRLRDESFSNQRVDHLLSRLGLYSIADRDAGQLSAGEAQRVAIGRTVMNEPDVLLLDEPTAHLDRDAERDVEELLENVMEDFDLTLVLVTHSQDQAERLCSRLVHLKDGQVYESGVV